jgi:transposase-like protein
VSTERLPRTLLEASRYFADLDVATEFVARLRWPDGPVCPACGGTEHSYLTTRRLWKCKNRECRKQFSVKVGTIFEDSPIPLDKWLCAIWLIANAKNGISSHELARSIGLTQKSAWFVLHRIRLAMQTGTFEKFDGPAEADETYVGGRGQFMHRSNVEGRAKAKTFRNKTIVAGALQRSTDDSVSQVRATVVPDARTPTLQNHVRDHVRPGATLYTDMHGAYRALGDEYDHDVIDHVQTYVRGQVHTNGIENFWALLKRGLKGTYVAASPEHLFRYVDERVFTFNMRNLDDYGRFQTVLRRVAGRRLTWADLVRARPY